MMETNVRKILQSLAETATEKANDAREYMQSAGKAVSEAVSEKSAAVKYGLELSKLRTEQDRIFSDIGHMMFMLNTGVLQATQPIGDDEKNPQQVINSLLVQAEQLQQQMDTISEKLSDAKNEKVCPLCGRLCEEHDTFCAVCGTKLTDKE